MVEHTLSPGHQSRTLLPGHHHCRRCEHPMLPAKHATGSGLRRHSGRGLCNACVHALTPDQLIDYERTTRSRDEVLADYDPLRRQGYPRRDIAARIGISLDALDRCLHRARHAGDPRAVLGPRR
jgi:transposase-like protein